MKTTESIVELELSVRAENGLRNAGIETLGDLLKLSVYDLRSIPHLGIKAGNGIIARLSHYGLSLHEDELTKLGDQLLKLRRTISVATTQLKQCTRELTRISRGKRP